MLLVYLMLSLGYIKSFLVLEIGRKLQQKFDVRKMMQIALRHQ